MSHHQIKYHTRYVLKEDRIIPGLYPYPAGCHMWRCNPYDYGVAEDDTRATGVPHVAMTLNEDGSYPFVTVPVTDLEEYQPHTEPV